jgi:glycosyltransferase XagB
MSSADPITLPLFEDVDQEIVAPPLENCARKFMTTGQWVFVAVVAAVIGGVHWVAWRDSILLLNAALGIFYGVLILHQVLMTLVGAMAKCGIRVSEEEIRALDETTLPRYTVLIPLFKEAERFEELLAYFSDLDYPKDKLEILFIIEECDWDTKKMYRRIRPAPPFRGVFVKDSYPRNKAKACDVALAEAKGDYVVIYGGRDRPEPAQLKKAVVAFGKCGAQTGCLQAKLDLIAPRQNILTKWFALESAWWFERFLPGLARFRAPVPLAGSSCHFRLETLLQIVGWDPFAVAADREMAVRLARKRLRTEILASKTWEQTPALDLWIRQRNRWLKGGVQAFLFHNRQPATTIAQMGLKEYVDFVLLTAGPFVGGLLNAYYWLTGLMWVFVPNDLLSRICPLEVFQIGAACWVLGNAAGILAAVLGCSARRAHGLIAHALLFPLYGLVLSSLAFHAGAQLLNRTPLWDEEPEETPAGEPPEGEDS